jgi:hypothetical protein
MVIENRQRTITPPDRTLFIVSNGSIRIHDFKPPAPASSRQLDSVTLRGRDSALDLFEVIG